VAENGGGDWGEGRPWMGGAVGPGWVVSPTFSFDEYAEGVQARIPVENLLFGHDATGTSVGGEEPTCDASAGQPDDRAEHLGAARGGWRSRRVVKARS
jgi:hypothetical protein